MQRTARMKKEIQMITVSPPPGISCWQKDESLYHLEAQIIGGEDTPYSGGIFKLEIQIPDRYPFEPPKVKFMTPIYHPNIDTAGRICLDTLKMPPKGAWKPMLNVGTVLTSIQLLMAEPNPEDPLMTDISNEFKHNKPQFLQTAKLWTEKHAQQSLTSGTSASSDTDGNQTTESIDGPQTMEGVLHNTDKVASRKRSLPMDDVTNKQPKPT
ncbi:ubiquitin-conjugating enzyme E2 T-like [Mya arenaria]|uniref:ubiquitin-conjugating enzyme E2 T-like n=1 Tax=Mya arenaria TaxID=6604 RepID=UPI0022E5FD33|nr:ubiquitin-conjugating enzyme E2 T-like [Mya arenaria]